MSSFVYAVCCADVCVHGQTYTVVLCRQHMSEPSLLPVACRTLSLSLSVSSAVSSTALFTLFSSAVSLVSLSFSSWLMCASELTPALKHLLLLFLPRSFQSTPHLAQHSHHSPTNFPNSHHPLRSCCQWLGGSP